MDTRSIFASVLLLGVLAGCEQSNPVSSASTYDPRYDGLVMLQASPDLSILQDQTKIVHAAPVTHATPAGGS